MNDDWLEPLRQLHELDKNKHLAEAEQEQQARQQQQAHQQHTADLLRRCRAHELLRQVQKALLGGKGMLDVFEATDKYERSITLVWQGPISKAQRPDPAAPGDYAYIMVGVAQGKIWVNDSPLPEPTPEALKVALVKACQNPAIKKQ